ncbi:MAG: HAD family hydrolase [Acidobacteria bacterium ACB1]|nr:HAD family hydrolase [Acidobacteria bacterium ACB1]RIJ92968.1 MAG: HAD family hydrolase [Acidobacteriota bacterium]
MPDKQMLTPAIFLDRDGTLIEEVNFLSRVEDLRIFPFTKAALQKLSGAGFLLFVVTNQSGIGRGLFTSDDMHNIHEALRTEFGGLISGFYYCPHLPDAGCDCRKPKTGLIERAAKEHAIDLQHSWFVGDKDLDIYTGSKAHMRTCLVSTGYGAQHKESLDIAPTLIVENIAEAAQEIVALKGI